MRNCGMFLEAHRVWILNEGASKGHRKLDYTILYYTILYTIYYILYTIYYILYTIYYILYTILLKAPSLVPSA